MSDQYKITHTTLFARNYRKLIKKHKEIKRLVIRATEILSSDPTNIKGKSHIRTLSNVAHGEGRWRIRVGTWRIRYDVEEQDVILHSIGHRKDIYRR